MTVVSHDTEAVYSCTQPARLKSLSESVLTCPKCDNAMEPMLLGMNEDGTQTVWWTCSQVKSKKCTFPLDMPQDIYWVTRSKQDIEKNEVPPPQLQNLPVRYQHLYPSFFQAKPKKPSSKNNSRQGSHESTNSGCSLESSSSSTVDFSDVNRSKTASKIDTMRKTKIVLAKRQHFPVLNIGALAYTQSLNQKDETVSTSVATTLKVGRGGEKRDQWSRAVFKKHLLSVMSKWRMGKAAARGGQSKGEEGEEELRSFADFSHLHLQDVKMAIVKHVKRKRAEKAKLEEIRRMQQRETETMSIQDLVKAKLQKNKREYQERRLEQARFARAEAAKRMRLAGGAAAAATRHSGFMGYEEEEDDQQQGPTAAVAAAYAVTPPHMDGVSSPGPSTSTTNPTHYASFDFGDGYYEPSTSSSSDYYPQMDQSMASTSSSGAAGGGVMDHSGEVPSTSGSYGDDEDIFAGGSPFADLGPLVEGDLEGLETDPDFEMAFNQLEDQDFDDIMNFN